MKVQAIFLKNDLIATIDGIGVDFSPTNVIVQRVGKLRRKNICKCFAKFLWQSISNGLTFKKSKRNMRFLQGNVWTCR